MQQDRQQFVAGWWIAACCALVGCGQPAQETPKAAAAPNAAPSPVVAVPTESGAKPTATTAGWGRLSGRFIVAGALPAPAAIIPGKDVAVCGKHKLVDESVVVGENGGLANVFVWVRSKGVAVHPKFQETAGDTLVLDNKNCRFEPHVLGLRTSQKLEVQNSDPMGHNTNFAMIANPPANPTLPTGSNMTYDFPQAETLPCKVQCNIHPWMTAWLLVRPDPYVAVSDKEGKFELKDLPAGELEFQVWQEKIGYVSQVKIGGSTPDWSRGRFKRTIAAGDSNLNDSNPSGNALGGNDLGDIVIAAAAFQK